MEKLEKAKHITVITFNAVWIVCAAILWSIGLNQFLSEKTFGNWMIWGAICSILIIVPLVRQLVKTTKKSVRAGEREGANTYTATRVGNTIHVQNNPMGGAIKGFFTGVIGGALGGILAGPIFVPGYFIIALLNIVNHSLALKRG